MVWLLVAVFLWISVTGCTERVDGAEASTTLRAERGRLERTLLLTGELVAAESTNLVAPNANIWPLTIRFLADEGAAVQAGDPVVEFDNSQLTGNVENLRSQVVSAANSLSRARVQASSDEATAFFELASKKAAYEKAALDAELPKELTSEQEWARLQLELRKARLEMEEAQGALDATRASSAAAVEVERLALDKAELALERAEQGIDLLTLRAPRDGLVTLGTDPMEDKPFAVGANVWPGWTVASLPELDSLQVKADLFDVDDGQLEVGQPVRATLDAFPGESIGGTVVAISDFATETSRRSTRRVFEVTVELERVDVDRLRPGMSVKVEVQVPSDEALLVPRGALDPGAPTDAPRVRLAGGAWRDVRLGACDTQFCEVVEGLDVGTRLTVPGGRRGGRT